MFVTTRRRLLTSWGSPLTLSSLAGLLPPERQSSWAEGDTHAHPEQAESCGHVRDAFASPLPPPHRVSSASSILPVYSTSWSAITAVSVDGDLSPPFWIDWKLIWCEICGRLCKCFRDAIVLASARLRSARLFPCGSAFVSVIYSLRLHAPILCPFS